MNLSRIKNLVKQNGDKVILVENDEPEVVVMSFSEYERMANGHANTDAAKSKFPSHATPDDIAFVDNGDIHETEFVRPAAMPARQSFLRAEEVRLEDLPL